MAFFDTLGRLAKLGFYLGLGGVSAVIQACGGDSTPSHQDADVEVPGEVDDGGAREDAAAADETTGDAEAGAEDAATPEDAAAAEDAEPEDAGQDLWDIPLE
jgi:hypothetical protein